MRTRMIMASLVVAGVATMTCQGSGIFGSRSSTPAQQAKRVSELLTIAQTSEEARKRESAVEELRDFNASTFGQIVPVLVQLLKSDPDTNVRIEAARSLGRIRPLLPMARAGLAEAVAKDSAIRVRWQARTSLMVYSVAGINPYNQATQEELKKPEVPAVTNKGNKGAPIFQPGPEIPVGSPILEPANAPILIPPPPGDFARPLPKGPTPKSVAPLPAPKQKESPKIVIPNVPTTQEPPLLPGNVERNQANPQPWRAQNPLPPKEGPILLPQGN